MLPAFDQDESAGAPVTSRQCKRAILRGLLESLPLWLLVECLLWRCDPERDEIQAQWRALRQWSWSRFVYEDMNYGRGELDHWEKPC